MIALPRLFRFVITSFVIAAQCLVVASAQSVNLDLSSTAKTTTPPSMLGTGTVPVQVGNSSQSFSAGAAVTPSERLAIYQILSSGHQSIVLGSGGNAVGGTFTMGSQFSQYVSAVNIPTGVTAIAVFGQPGYVLNLSGSLSNAGSIYAAATNTGVSTATIKAMNIFNGQGGIISSAIPFGISLPIHSLVSNLSLSLISGNNIINNGTISSAGNLSMTAINAIMNGTLTGAQALVQSMGSMNLQASTLSNFGTLTITQGDLSMITSSLVNAGSINALAGNIAITSPLSSLLVDSTGGAITSSGSINFSTAIGSTTSPGSLSLTGGTLNATNVSFTSPGGSINVFANSIGGIIDLSGCSASVGTEQGNLNIGSTQLTGDPLFFAQAGSLDLSGPLSSNTTTGGADFIALAKGNITASSQPRLVTIDATLNAGSVPAPGGKIVLAAGVDFSLIPTTAGLGYAITGASSTGGNIYLPQVNLRTNGNNISLEAHNGSDSAGFIQVGSVETSGAGGGAAQSGPGIVGQSAGNIKINADSSVGTGFLRAYGGGGGGAFLGDGGAGGNGGNVNIWSTNGLIYVQGDINASGGGGGSAFVNFDNNNGALPTAGGRGGDGGNISLNAPRQIVIEGPALAVGGGGGGGGNVTDFGFPSLAGGGGSLGGGGGGQSSLVLNGAGGGIFGGGAPGISDPGLLGSGGGGGFFGGGSNSAGSFGLGGNDGSGKPSAPLGVGGIGSIIDLNTFDYVQSSVGSGGNAGQAGMPVGTAPGGQPGISGNIQMAGSLIHTGSVASYYGSLGMPNVQSSPFAFASIFTTGKGLVILSVVPGVTTIFDKALIATIPVTNLTTTEILANKLPTDVTDTESTGRRAILEGTISKIAIASQQLFATSTSADSFNAAEMNRLAAQGAIVTGSSVSNFLKLEKGNVLFTPADDIVIALQEGTVYIPGGSVALVVETGHDAAIYCLHQPPLRNVKVVSANRTTALMPGRQMVLTRAKSGSFNSLDSSLRTIAHRNENSAVLGDGIRTFFADFSIESALMNVAPLRSMVDSSRPTDRRLVDRMLKDAVILSEIAFQSSPYQRNSTQP